MYAIRRQAGSEPLTMGQVQTIGEAMRMMRKPMTPMEHTLSQVFGYGMACYRNAREMYRNRGRLDSETPAMELARFSTGGAQYPGFKMGFGSEVKVSVLGVDRQGSKRLFNRKRRQCTEKGKPFEAEHTEGCFAQLDTELRAHGWESLLPSLFPQSIAA